MIKSVIHRQDIEALGRMDLIAKQIVQGFITGLHKSPFHGFSVEFSEHRLYNPGEDTRHVDWRLFARSEKLFTKQYEEETNLRCRFVIDSSRSMYYPEANASKFSKIEFACYAVAALSEILKHQRDAFGVSYFGDSVYYHSELKSTSSHQNFLFQELDKLIHDDDRRNTDLVNALHEISEQAAKRSLIILFSDLFSANSDFDGIIDALLHLKHNKHEVVLFHTFDEQTELMLDFGNKEIEFVDLERQLSVKANPLEIQEEYRQRVLSHQNQIKIRCGELGIDYYATNVALGFNKLLLDYLIKRQKMKK